MELVLEPGPDGGAAATVACLAAEQAGLSFGSRQRTPGRWWRAGLDDALDRVPVGPPRPAAYEAARSPRSTRGATRA